MCVSMLIIDLLPYLKKNNALCRSGEFLAIKLRKKKYGSRNKFLMKSVTTLK
jgi:hypothetical protein